MYTDTDVDMADVSPAPYLERSLINGPSAAFSPKDVASARAVNAACSKPEYVNLLDNELRAEQEKMRNLAEALRKKNGTPAAPVQVAPPSPPTLKEQEFYEDCVREARGIHCSRNQCKHVHRDQRVMFAALIAKLPFPNQKAKMAVLDGLAAAKAAAAAGAKKKTTTKK
jgi:hypothetical protein